MRNLLVILTLISISSCSIFKEKEQWIDIKEIQPIKEDYEEHLISLGNNYINSPNVKTIKLSKSSRKYLESLYLRLTNDNEALFRKKFIPKFYIIKNRTPFYFSLPRGHFYFSLGLIKKFITNEELLVAVLSGEIVKSLSSIYQKHIVVPVGYMRTERMLSLARISFDMKNEINRWAYFVLHRSGYDPAVYLTWLQLQNRNTLEFSLQYGNVQSISREEFSFKNFVSKNRKKTELPKRRKSITSLSFYKMINELKRVR